MDVSVVIPTRNRTDSLCRLLWSLKRQTCKPREVIIVDSSDSPLESQLLQYAFRELNITFFHSRPSVCAQRNLGIRAAVSPYVFLCDDDMEIPADYVGRLVTFLMEHPHCGAVSGIVVEPGDDTGTEHGFYPISLGMLLKAFLFQLTVWSDLDALKARFPASVLLTWLKRFYRWRGNTVTFAGWPLLTQVTRPFLHTSIYGLGASIVRREWLLMSPFDEQLDEHGIGDNYGVALGFPSQQPITVLTDLSVAHNKSAENRLCRMEAYIKRVLALHYFMTTNARFSGANRFMLLWSILGHLLTSALNRDAEMARATLRVLSALITGNNPYLVKQQSKVFPISTNLRHYVGRLYFVTTYRFYYKPKLNRTDHVRLFGFRLTIPPGVFHPGLFFSTKIFGTYLLSADFRGKRVLEMGSGSGLLSLIAASRGASVTSTDVNALAVETTRTNADTNGLGNHIRTRGGNLFEGIDQSNLYDYIVWNPPFYPQEPHNEEERAWKAGDSYRVLEQFAKASKRYLARDGRILINLSSHIDNNKILTFFTKEGYTIHQLTHRHSFFEKFVICEIGR